jgi:hypothetical protein
MLPVRVPGAIVRKQTLVYRARVWRQVPNGERWQARWFLCADSHKKRAAAESCARYWANRLNRWAAGYDHDPWPAEDSLRSRMGMRVPAKAEWQGTLAPRLYPLTARCYACDQPAGCPENGADWHHVRTDDDTARLVANLAMLLLGTDQAEAWAQAAPVLERSTP